LVHGRAAENRTLSPSPAGFAEMANSSWENVKVSWWGAAEAAPRAMAAMAVRIVGGNAKRCRMTNHKKFLKKS
jgi:hypothetical protein